jgi:hypothetical protein
MNVKIKILASYTIVFLATIVMILLSFDYFESNTIEKNDHFFCGTVSRNSEFKEGEKLFKSLCASCHKLDKFVLGPSLKNIEIDSISLFQYLKSEKHKPTYPQLTQKNINDIL